MLSTLTSLALLRFVAAEQGGAWQPPNTGCPPVWYQVSRDLSASFDGCTNLARAAIRFAFHDASTYSCKTPPYPPATGGADGSLLLSAEEIQREVNHPLIEYHGYLLSIYNHYKDQGVGAADLIQFAGHHATVTCPGGPTVKTLIGRKDTDKAAPDNLLPPGFGKGSDYNSIVSLFADKGIYARDLAALIGAHTVSKAFAQQANGIPYGGPQDTTPETWDVAYYAQMYNPQLGAYRFQSDINLSQKNTTVGQAFASFVGNPQTWAEAFADAYYRMSLLGLSSTEGLIDCTMALPPPKVPFGKRTLRRAPITRN